jgi:hypothetical protein
MGRYLGCLCMAIILAAKIGIKQMNGGDLDI